MAEQAKEEAPAKNNKKLFIIIGAALAVVAVAGIAAMLLMGGGKSKKAEGGHGEEAKVEKKEEGGHGEGGKEGGKPASSVYALEPFIVNIYDGQEIRYLKLKVEFEQADPAVKAELDAKVAPLRDAILVLLTTKTMQEISDLQGKNQLRDQILSAVNKIIPPGRVLKVYFTDFVVQ